MANSGYIMIDCEKLNLLAQSSQTIDGIYDAVMSAIESGKPIIACNCEYGEDVPLTPIPVFCIIQGTEIVATSSILQIWIQNDDSVRIVSLLT